MALCWAYLVPDDAVANSEGEIVERLRRNAAVEHFVMISKPANIYTMRRPAALRSLDSALQFSSMKVTAATGPGIDARQP